MILTSSQSIILIIVAALCTFITRAIPFIIFGRKKEVPKEVEYLGKALPPAIIATLIIYCVKYINLVNFPSGIPEIISIIIVAVLHIWKRNTLISIGCGTIIYMMLVQYVFI